MSTTTTATDHMFDVVAVSFFKKKSCRLPGIGTLDLVTVPAEYDFLTRQIKAPRQQIVFISAAAPDHHFNEFSALSQLMLDRLKTDGIVIVNGLGSFCMNEAGSIQFTASELNEALLPAVIAEKVIHKDAEHSILVGERETTNTEMTEYYSESATDDVDERWWIWALVVAALAIAAIVPYVMQHGFNNLASHTTF